LAGGCSGHALAQAVNLGELGDVVDLATSGQAIFLFICFGLAGKVLFLNCKKKRTVVILAWKKIGWMWFNLEASRGLMTCHEEKYFQTVSKETV
jgi:hypothetical protein